MASAALEKVKMAIVELDYKTLTDLAAQNRNKKQQYTFYNAFKTNKESDMETLIGDLSKMIFSSLEKYLRNGKADWASLDNEACSELNNIIQASVDIAMTSFELDYAPSRNLLQMVVMLNGIILEIPNSFDNLKNSIAHLCEKMCCADFIDKSQYFLFNVLIYLLRRTLEKKSLKTDVRRVYSMRETIRNIMCMDKINKVEIWELFKKCATSSLYLDMPEGQKIIALSMTLDIDKISEMHAVMRSHLRLSSLKVAASYGRIYFDAWNYCMKTKKAALKNVIELSCLQDIIVMGIKEPRRSVMTAVRKVLHEFHLHKKEFVVAKMLYFLYQPIIWRYIKNPNGQIRANATQLLLDIFPLEDPDIRVVETDLELNDQLLMIHELLTDEYPLVRYTTIIGLCFQMSINWEVFPEEMLKTYLKTFINDLCGDSSSHEVRCAVAKGLKVLLENPLTINTMKNYLPKVADLFHDISESVRVAFCQLLLKVKTISAIKYFDIVPLDHLLARMEEDCHVVQKSIANLIHNSYFPKNGDPKIWLGRSLLIMKPNTAKAARVFFTHASSFIGVENSVKFIIQAIKAVHFYVRTKKTSTEVCSFLEESSNKENIADGKTYVSLEEAVGFHNLPVVKTLLDCIGIMWMSLKTDAEKANNKRYWKMLVAKVGKPLADLCLHYKNTEVWESVSFVSSFLPANTARSLASLCFLRLKNLPLTAEPSMYMHDLESLCNQQQSLELLDLLVEWINVGLTNSYSPPPAKKRKSIGKNGESVYFNQPKPYLANEMLYNMIRHKGMQKSILTFEDKLKEILYFVDHVKRKIEKSTAKTLKEEESAFLQLLLFNILRISVFLHDEDSLTGVQLVDETIIWVEKKLLKHLKIVKKKPDIHVDLIFAVCQRLCEVISDVTALGFIDPTSKQYIHFFEKILQTGHGSKYALIAARFLFKFAVSAYYLNVKENESEMLKVMFSSICDIFLCFSSDTFLKSIPTSELKEIELLFANVLHITHNFVAMISEASDIFKFVARSSLDSLLPVVDVFVKKEADDGPRGCFEAVPVPKTYDFYRSVVTQKPKSISMYVKYVVDFLNDEYLENDVGYWIAGCIICRDVQQVKSNLTKESIIEIDNLIRSLSKNLKLSSPDLAASLPGAPQIKVSPKMKNYLKHCHVALSKLKNQQVGKLKDTDILKLD